jgi:hypothetical protein
MRKNPVLLYFTSNLNIIVTLITVVLILNALLFGEGDMRTILSLGFLAIYFAITLVLLLARFSMRDETDTRTEEYAAQIEDKIQYYIQIRDRISGFDIEDEEVKKQTDHFVQVSGDYIDRCSALAEYSPQANRRMEEVHELLHGFVDRVGMTSSGDEAEKDFVDYKIRTLNAIRDASNFIKGKMQGSTIALTHDEKMELMDEQ